MKRGEAWSAANPGNRAAREELLAAIQEVAQPEIQGEGALLDCGCGSGWLLEALANSGVEPSRLHGVDADADRVEIARRRVPSAEIALGDATDLPFPEDAFDAVFFVVSLSSMGPASAVRQALSEGLRVLTPNGAVVIYEPRLANPFNRTTRRLRHSDPRATGLTPVESRSLTLFPPLGRRFGPLTDRLHPALSRISLLRSHRLVVCR